MSDKQAQFALVTEGKTDQIVLSTLLSQTFLNCDRNAFQYLQPNIDNTNKETTSEGGWRQVNLWCLRNPPAVRQALFKDGLFTTTLSSTTYKALIIHLDGDLCDKADFKDSHTLNEADFDLQQVEGRSQYLSAVLQHWLNTEIEEPIIFALAIESIETWLLAGLGHDLQDIENDRDPEQTLLSLLKEDKRPLGKVAQASQKTLKKTKTPEQYKKLSNQAAKNIDQIKASCPHFSNLCDQIAPFINNP
jgi:hypothetical protein